MFVTFLIMFRESLEAFLLVGILLAYLQQLEATRYAKWIYVGVFAGILAALGSWAQLTRQIGPQLKKPSKSSNRKLPFWIRARTLLLVIPASKKPSQTPLAIRIRRLRKLRCAAHISTRSNGGSTVPTAN